MNGDWKAQRTQGQEGCPLACALQSLPSCNIIQVYAYHRGLKVRGVLQDVLSGPPTFTRVSQVLVQMQSPWPIPDLLNHNLLGLSLKAEKKC